MKLGKIWIFGTPLKTRNISLKHLKLPKNHFKTNLFFVQLKHWKSTFTFGGKIKIKPSPPSYQKVQISNLGLFDFSWWPLPPFSDFFQFLLHIFIQLAPLILSCYKNVFKHYSCPPITMKCTIIFNLIDVIQGVPKKIDLLYLLNISGTKSRPNLPFMASKSDLKHLR